RSGRKPYPQEGSHGSPHTEWHWQRVLGRDPARRATFPDRAHAQATAARVGNAVRRHAAYAQALDRPAAGRNRGRLPRKRHRLPQRNGGSWPVWRALPAVWRKDSANSLCGQRNELLRSVPDRWKSARGSRFVTALAIRLAADARRTRSPQAPLAGWLECASRPIDFRAAMILFSPGALCRNKRAIRR